MLAKAFGAEGFTVNNLPDFKNILYDYSKSGLPCVIDCKIDMDEKVLPMIPPGGSVKDIIFK